jgi:hypothetical protein
MLKAIPSNSVSNPSFKRDKGINCSSGRAVIIAESSHHTPNQRHSPRTFTTAILALPPFLSLPADVPRTAAGMFTISYTCAIIIPTICGALWDLTGKPWTAFVPLCLCAVALAVLGTVVTRRSPDRSKAAQG